MPVLLAYGLFQGGRVIAYTRRTLTIAERNYSIIQREFLGIIFTLKQLAGKTFHPSYSSCTITVAGRSENGRIACSLGPCHAGI